jgi:hypothetical protein
MPVLARFYGLVIKMYFQQSEHNPPHIHVIYGEYVGVLDLATARMMERRPSAESPSTGPGMGT